jgi:hypothetical protein
MGKKSAFGGRRHIRTTFGPWITAGSSTQAKKLAGDPLNQWPVRRLKVSSRVVAKPFGVNAARRL